MYVVHLLIFSPQRVSAKSAGDHTCAVLAGAQYTFALHHLFTVGVPSTGFFLLGDHEQGFRGLGVFCKLPGKRAVDSWSLK